MVVKGEKKTRELSKTILINQSKRGRKQKNKYIPNLAEFYFKPDEDWTLKEANELYDSTKNEFNEKIFYEACIKGMDKLPDAFVDLVLEAFDSLCESAGNTNVASELESYLHAVDQRYRVGDAHFDQVRQEMELLSGLLADLRSLS